MRPSSSRVALKVSVAAFFAVDGWCAARLKLQTRAIQAYAAMSEPVISKLNRCPRLHKTDLFDA
jgi:hypothetical protein